MSGRVTAIAIDPTDPNIVYVGTAQGGVYRTLDGGTNWAPIFDRAQSLAIGAIAIAPSSHTTVYVGTGEANLGGNFAGIGLYRIDNATTTADLVGPINPTGSNAVGTGTAFTGRAISKILVHPTDPATIFVSTGLGVAGKEFGPPLGGTVPPLSPLGLYRSTNATAALGSVTFAKLTVTSAVSVAPDATGNRTVFDIAFDPTNPNHLVASVFGSARGTDGGLYLSTNALAAPASSVSFTKTLTLKFQRAAFAFNVVGGKVTALAATGESNGALRKSTDGGATWGERIAGAKGFCGGQCFYDIAVAVDPTDAKRIMLGGNGRELGEPPERRGPSTLTRSIDGSTFVTSDNGLHADTHVIQIAPSPNNAVVYTGNDGGIFKSVDSGVHWTSLNNAQFSATQFQSLAVHPTDANFTIGGTQDNGTELRDSAGAWRRADYGDGGFSLIDQTATDTTNVVMYHTYFNLSGLLIGYARVDKTSDAHDDGWQFFGCGADGSPEPGNGISCADATLFYAPLASGPAGAGRPDVVYFGTDRLYRSTDKGENNTIVSQAPLVKGVPISAIGIARQNDNLRLVGLMNGRVFRTTTGSATLADVTGTLPAQFVARAVIDPDNVDVAYVTLGGFFGDSRSHVWKTTNLTSATPTWTATGRGIPDIPVNGFVVDPANPSILYAGTDIGVYSSTDAGTTWAPFGSGLPVVSVFDMAIAGKGTPNEVLRIATYGRGMWDIPAALVTKASPTVQTTASPTVAVGAGTIHDTAVLAGGSNPTGSITFSLYGPDTCSGQAVFTSTKSVAGNASYVSADFAPNVPGTYHWRASYSGDANNNAVAPSPCPDPAEAVVVGPSQPTPCGSTTTGMVPGPVVVASGHHRCFVNATVNGRITVNPGGELTVTRSTVLGGIISNGARALDLCSNDIGPASSGPALSVTNTAGPVRIGDPATGCNGNNIRGGTNLAGNFNGLVFGSNYVQGGATVNANMGGPILLRNNLIDGTLACSANAPPPTDSSQPNAADAKTGQCNSL